ncbi:MAG: hypothetical protein HY332_21525 [Chloroflexi bacterium]|nr:hypothetical protein [Chloroflexota bacterium]
MSFDRQSRVWHVRETDYCLFHLEPPLHEDADLAKEFFLNSHYRDEHLASTLERTTGLTVEELAAQVGTWWRSRAAAR